MERLTKERLGNLKGKKFVLCNNADNSDCNDFCRYGICRWNEKAQMRLHEYEDTGLTPAEIERLIQAMDLVNAIIKKSLVSGGRPGKEGDYGKNN